MENLTVMGMPVRMCAAYDAYEIVHPSGRTIRIPSRDLYYGGFDVLRGAAAKLKREVEMGCSPMIEVSGAMREMMQQQQQAALHQQMLAQQAQSQLAQALGVRGLTNGASNWYMTTDHTTPNTDIDFNQIQRQLEEAKKQMEQQYSEQYYGTTTGPKKQEQSCEYARIDDVPVLEWLRHRIDRVWHKGIELMEKAMPKREQLVGGLAQLRHHGVLKGVL
jgi:hypothetical protein